MNTLDQDLGALLRPRSIAVVGVSSDPQSQGRTWLEALDAFRFPGPVYPVNPAFSEVIGQRCYPHLRDIPGPVDHVISCIPAALVPGLVEECLQKGVKLLHLYTGRFSETGEDDRIELEARIGERAREGGLRLIGPNCMGLYYPAQGISFRLNFPREPGAVGYLSQSGGNSEELIYRASLRGARFSKAVSYGNALDINECHLLEHFARDPETRVIAAYIEGVKDGHRFFRLLKETAPRKPVVILKGGRSEAGARATSSHTASLAGSEATWNALFRQTGALRASSIDELADLVLAFLFLPRPRGRRVAVMGGGGGRSVLAADECEQAGLEVPSLSPALRQALKEIAPETHFVVRNPLDSSALFSRQAYPKIIKLMAEWEGVDLLIMVMSQWSLDRPQAQDSLRQSVDSFLELHRELPQKPMAVVLGSPEAAENWRWRAVTEEVEKCARAGLPVYPEVSRAARALAQLCEYHEFFSS